MSLSAAQQLVAKLTTERDIDRAALEITKDTVIERDELRAALMQARNWLERYEPAEATALIDVIDKILEASNGQ
jgi:hypothetical protein